jgi:hypothetical protein
MELRRVTRDGSPDLRPWRKGSWSIPAAWGLDEPFPWQAARRWARSDGPPRIPLLDGWGWALVCWKPEGPVPSHMSWRPVEMWFEGGEA